MSIDTYLPPVKTTPFAVPYAETKIKIGRIEAAPLRTRLPHNYNKIPQIYRDYVYSVVVYQKNLMSLGELIIFEDLARKLSFLPI